MIENRLDSFVYKGWRVYYPLPGKEFVHVNNVLNEIKTQEDMIDWRKNNVLRCNCSGSVGPPPPEKIIREAETLIKLKGI